MTRGEVWWLERPDGKARLVCVLTRDEAIPALQSVVVAEATTTVRGIPGEVELDGSDGMPRGCVLSFDNISTYPKSLFTERITELSPARMDEVCQALAFATGCR